jgi:uncharacterized protein YyaL (SSP411 family)
MMPSSAPGTLFFMTRTIDPRYAVTAVTSVVLLLIVGCKPATPPTPPAAQPAAAKPAEPAKTTAAPVPPREHGEPNALAGETSPYLLQHAHNPVDWHPWGPEAIALAQQQDKPIFLSVGYSTCYWCHVMERETFEDPEVAALMNEHFINIKLDREERPDLDDIYMQAVRFIMGGGGGWPLSAFLEPFNLKPFHGGTYYRKGQFMELLREQAEAWANDRQTLLANADKAGLSVIRSLAMAALPVPLGGQDVENGVRQVLSSYDRTYGGIGGRGGSSKFPSPSRWRFVLHADWENKFSRDAVMNTLNHMAMGGIYDQVGGGFHRYSTDQRWLVPHFEKMLYDNAQLASLYADAYEKIHDPFYARIVRETLEYVLREMTGPEGRFYSAQDAEVNEREGGSYVWTTEEVTAALQEAGREDLLETTLQMYGLKGGPNFIDPHHPKDGQKNVLYMVDDLVGLAQSFSMSLQEVQTTKSEIDTALRAMRDKREQPLTDDKTIVSWNGLMIAGMADGGRVLREQRYIDAAYAALDFIMNEMKSPEGGLLRTYRDGRARIDAMLVDYAYLIHGILALHRATDDDTLVAMAVELADRAQRDFGDPAGGWFDTTEGRDDLFVRTKTWGDGVRPGGNSLMVHNLLDLYDRTGDEAHLERAAAGLGFLSSRIKRGATSSTLGALAMYRFVQEHPAYLPGESASPIDTTPPVTITASVDRADLRGAIPSRSKS